MKKKIQNSSQISVSGENILKPPKIEVVETPNSRKI